MRLGILTGGGDCPGLNAAIRAVVSAAPDKGYDVIGIRRGWEGLLTRNAAPLTWQDVQDITSLGGTILKTSRTNPVKDKETRALALENSERLGLDAMIAIGGDDTLGAANELSKDGLRCIGIPKTIDNDVNGTDVTIGFDTVVNIAMKSIDRIHTTARSHERVVLVEVMGRYAGWVALHSGVGSGAHMILIPEVPVAMEEVAQYLLARKRHGHTYSLIVVAEGVKTDGRRQSQASIVDEFGHELIGGVSRSIARELENLSGLEVRNTVLGYIQRGGSPTLFDRVLASRFGLAALELVSQKRFGEMVALRGNEIISIPLYEATSKPKLVPRDLYESLSPLWLRDGHIRVHVEDRLPRPGLQESHPG